MVLAQGQDGNTTVRLNICMSTEYSLRHSQNYHSLSHSQTFPTFYCYDGLISAAVYSSALTALHYSDLSLVHCAQSSSYDQRPAVSITALTGAQPCTTLQQLVCTQPSSLDFITAVSALSAFTAFSAFTFALAFTAFSAFLAFLAFLAFSAFSTFSALETGSQLSQLWRLDLSFLTSTV